MTRASFIPKFRNHDQMHTQKRKPAAKVSAHIMPYVGLYKALHSLSRPKCKPIAIRLIATIRHTISEDIFLFVASGGKYPTL